MYYIQEADKPDLITKLLSLIEIVDDKIILPIEKNGNISEKKIKRLTKKIEKLINKANCKTIILSKYLKHNENLIMELKNKKVKLVEGKWLFNVIIYEILDYICEKKEIKKEEINISIMVDENFSDYILENIKKIIKNYKSVNIVTNHSEKLKKLEESILQQEGTVITITNNKKKSLKRSKIIVNVDFDEEKINKYFIPDEAIIINLKDKINIRSKRFNGININDYEIDFENNDNFDYEKEKLYFKKDIYEALIYKKQPYEFIERKIKKDKVKVIRVIGKRTSL